MNQERALKRLASYYHKDLRGVVTIDGESWSWATEGGCILAFRGKHVALEERDDATNPTILRYLKRPEQMGEVTRTTIADILRFARDVLKCRECDGLKAVMSICSDCGHEHEHKCPRCEGSGTEAGYEVAIIGGRCVKTHRLENLMSSFTEDALVLMMQTPHVSDGLYLEGDGWRAVIAGNNRDAGRAVRTFVVAKEDER